MRNALLLATLGLATLSFVAACGDAASSSGIRRGSNPTAGSPDTHDPNDQGDQNNGPANPNATTPPDAPTNPGTGAATYDVAVDNATPQADLGNSVDINVTVTPKTGASGTATLSVNNLPAGATATFNPASVTLGTAPVTSKLTIAVPVTAVPTKPGTFAALAIVATDGAAQATANANFKINAALRLQIPLNVDALRQANTRYIDDWGGPAFGATPTALKTQAKDANDPLLATNGNPIVVTVYNADSKAHIVHGQNGFAHGDTANPVPATSVEMQNGTPRLRSLVVGTNAQGYPHDGTQGVGASFQISIVAAP